MPNEAEIYAKRIAQRMRAQPPECGLAVYERVRRQANERNRARQRRIRMQNPSPIVIAPPERQLQYRELGWEIRTID
jgi:hypothetical protein